MPRTLPLLLTLLAGPAAAEGRAPVVLELFSSEGCSSCPAADAVLARLDAEQPVPGAQVLALELHVDYWNRLGWADPFSRPEFTERQERYARAFEGRGLYTPQLVVDGAAELVGSREEEARAAIARAAQAPKAQVAVAVQGGRATVEVRGAERGEVLLALTERGLATAVPRGENAGRTLRHAPVVRRLWRLGAVQGGAFRAEAEVALPAGVDPARCQVVALVQDPQSMRVLGAGAAGYLPAVASPRADHPR